MSIADVPLDTGGVLRYALASSASGAIRPTPQGREIRFTATVRATLETGGPKDGSFDYTIPFSTEAAAADDRAGTETAGASIGCRRRVSSLRAFAQLSARRGSTSIPGLRGSRGSRRRRANRPRGRGASARAARAASA